MTDRSVTKQKYVSCPECSDKGASPSPCIYCGKSDTRDAGSRPDELGEHARAPERLPKAGAQVPFTSNERLYAKRDHYALSPHFERHMLALTSEELQSKSAIAAELAHRDAEIERLTLEFRLSSQQAAALRDERERLRAALLYWRNECSGREPSLSVFERMIDRSLSGDSSTSSDGSGRPTVPNDAVNATTSTGPGPSDETTNDDAARYRWMKEHWIGFECRTKEGPMRLIANIDKDLDGWIDACRFNRLYEPPAQETSINLDEELRKRDRALKATPEWVIACGDSWLGKNGKFVKNEREARGFQSYLTAQEYARGMRCPWSVRERKQFEVNGKEGPL